MEISVTSVLGGRGDSHFCNLDIPFWLLLLADGVLRRFFFECDLCYCGRMLYNARCEEAGKPNSKQNHRASQSFPRKYPKDLHFEHLQSEGSRTSGNLRIFVMSGTIREKFQLSFGISYSLKQTFAQDLSSHKPKTLIETRLSRVFSR